MVISRLPKPDPMLRVRAQVLALTEHEGHTAVAPDLCMYRFTRPTRFAKSATFGVTLLVVLQGVQRVHIDGAQLHVDPHQFLVFTRETEFEAEALDATEDRPFLSFALCFSPERVAKALLALADAGGVPTAEATGAFAMPRDLEIGEAVERLLRTLDDPIERTLIAPLVVDEIMFRLLRSDAAAAVRAGVGPADAARILEAMQFIRANLTRKLDVKRVAREVAMSPSHFAHRFRAIARTTPMRYLREVRLERARALLVERGARAGNVASQVGFESAAHFAREFKRRFGSPPSHFMRLRALDA